MTSRRSSSTAISSAGSSQIANVLVTDGPLQQLADPLPVAEIGGGRHAQSSTDLVEVDADHAAAVADRAR